ncbi:T9SS type A sorting domain-containing protein [Adhaeribacter sp. BT258]|uniref:T9SS type A sorting domain-containing protein n=1 Tax=Adhaeribacter terrigena TaxID=2793070 RepID=A0ABS1C1A0_9BACT|nr:T9SS type A sorting domain-containing protein [Adhaeribacter terrigena]MBK0403179.1 T9SS type A sorting domain-containing protein [Adhaeribacter terrigena]
MRNFIPNFSQFRLLALVISLICSTVVAAWAQASISGFSPNSGPVGTVVTINGSNFVNVTAVRFNSTPATSFNVVSPTQITATVATGTTIGKIFVVSNGATVSSTSDFTPYVTWTGSVSSDWDNGGNWADGATPGATTNVVINPGTPHAPQINDAAICNNLTVSTGASLSLVTGADFTVKGVFSNLGSYSQSAGKITFAADGGTQQIPALTYYDLAINGSGLKQIQGNITVAGNLTLAGNNNLTTAQPSNILTLNGSISGETATRNFIGRLEKTRLVDQNTSFDVFGNIGVHFDNAGNGNWGNVVVTRVTGAAITNPNNPTYHSINRYWDIVPQNPNTNTLVSLTLTWLTSENNGLDFVNNKAQAWRSEDNGGSWTPVDVPQTITPTTGNGERSITVATNTFSKWGVSDQNNPLPVSWLYVNAKATANGNVLNWATASEKNSDNFVVERSVNGKNFEAIGSVKAAGNSSQILTYSFTDATPAAERTYYRLKQTDADGAFAYSTIVVVERSGKGRTVEAAVYPNPFAGNLNLKLQPADGVKEVKLISLDGKEVYRKAIVAETNVTLNDLPVLKPGMYLLQLHGANGITTLKVARQ